MFCFCSCDLGDCGEHMGTMRRCPFHTVAMVNLPLSSLLVNVKLLNNKANKKDTCVTWSSDCLPQGRFLLLGSISPGNENHVIMPLFCHSCVWTISSASRRLKKQESSQILLVPEKMAAMPWKEIYMNDPMKGKDLCNLACWLAMYHVAASLGLLENLGEQESCW